MAEPKKRHTSARSGSRRSHLAKKTKSLSICPQCKESKQAHKVCPSCGFYNGKDILEIEKKAKAKEEKRKQKEKENE
jgi:large subunit ribosomal protein L32